MPYCALALLVAIAVPSVAGTGAVARKSYVWRNVTVGGGGFAPGIVFSPAERGLAYLRTDMGGAYRFDARAARWVALQDGLADGSLMGVESVAADPCDPGVVYLAAGMSARSPSAILRSRDRGTHWTITPVPFAMGGNEDGRGLGERLAIDPFDTATLLFGSRHDGLWRSTDRGAHWAKVASFPLPGLGRPDDPRRTHGGLGFVLFDPARRGRIIVASADFGAQRLFRSDDAGAHWQALVGGPDPALAPMKGVIGRDGMLTITFGNAIGPNGITRGAVWRVDAAGTRWRDVTPDMRPDAPPGGYMGVAVSAQDPQVIAVSTVDRYRPVDTVWRSQDGGAHWDELQTRSTRDISATPFLGFDRPQSDFGHWIAALAIDPFDDRHAAYGTGATLYETDRFAAPGTMPWRPWTRGIEQTAIITLVSPTGGAPLVSGFGDIAGFRHDDLAVSPPHLHRAPLLSNTNTLDYAGRAPAVMVRSGSTHSAVVPGASLAWSQDGGESWQPLTVHSATPPAGRPAPEATGDAAIVVSADGAIFLAGTAGPQRTLDRGAHWRPVAGLSSGSRIVADKVDPRRFYAIDAASRRLLRSDDGGAHFVALAAPGLPADLGSALPRNRESPSALLASPARAGALWLLVDRTLYRSTDAGAYWRGGGGALAIDLFGLGKPAPGASSDTLYALGRAGAQAGVWRSTDAGAHWSQINDPAHQWGLRIRCITGDPRRFGRVYVGTDGRGIVYGDPTTGEDRR
jgi:hypothetical protein